MQIGTRVFEHKFIPPPGGEECKNLLVLVHGKTGNLRLLEWYSKRFKIPHLGYLTIQAPYLERRPNQDEDAYSWYLDKREGLEESRKKIDQLVEELVAQGFASEQIYWLGFSQGSAMCLDLAVRSNKKFGGFLCISGFFIFSEEHPVKVGSVAKSQQILITHGERDEIVTLDRALHTYAKLKELDIPFELKIYDKPHSFHLKQEVPELEQKLKDWMK